jgi:hypothetical protein
MRQIEPYFPLSHGIARHILDLVALTVERPVMLDWFLAICF